MSNSRIVRLDRFSEIFKALSNPHRLSIFLRLASCCSPLPAKITKSDKGEYSCACVGELGDKLGIVPSTVSHHIKELKRAGLINIKRSGQHVQCWIEPDILRELSEFFGCMNKG